MLLQQNWAMKFQLCHIQQILRNATKNRKKAPQFILELIKQQTINSIVRNYLFYISQSRASQIPLNKALSKQKLCLCKESLGTITQKALLIYLGISLDDEIKAILCLLILNLYIDQEPRSIIYKPSFLGVLNHNSQRGKDEITERFIEINLTNDIEGTYQIRKCLIQYLKAKIEYLEVPNINEDKTTRIYIELTYEVIRCISLMVKFGLFSKHANQLLKTTLHLNNKNIEANFMDNELKNLVCYLAKFYQNIIIITFKNQILNKLKDLVWNKSKIQNI